MQLFKNKIYITEKVIKDRIKQNVNFSRSPCETFLLNAITCNSYLLQLSVCPKILTMSLNCIIKEHLLQ